MLRWIVDRLEPRVTICFAFLLAGLHIAVAVSGYDGQEWALEAFGLTPAPFWRFPDIPALWSYGLVHIDPDHWVSNTLPLLFLGAFLEPRLGRRQTLLLIATSIPVAGLAHVLVEHSSPHALHGASGVVFAYLGALACSLAPGWLREPLRPILLVILAGVSLWLLWRFSAAYVPPGGTVSEAAHLGGLIWGAAFGLIALPSRLETEEAP